MGREEYLRELARHLARVPEETRQEMLADYAEHFAAASESGKSDAEIVRALGTPRQVAAACRADMYVAHAEAETRPGPKAWSLARAALAVLGLGFFNCVFVAGPFIGAVFLLLGVWMAAATPLLIGGGLIIEAATTLEVAVFSTLYGFGHILLGAGLVCLSALLMTAMAMATRWFLEVTARYVRLNLEIIAQ